MPLRLFLAAVAAGAVVAAGAAATSCGPSSPTVAPRPPVVDPGAGAHYDAELLRTLMVLATRREPTAKEVEATGRELASGRLTIERYVDSLVASPEFSDNVAPLVILRHLLNEDALSAPSEFVLERTTGPDPVYYFGKPCKPGEAVLVRPWWDLDHEVKICSASYRPAQWVAQRPKGEPMMDCLSVLPAYLPADGGNVCGCGPNLIRCFESKAQRLQVVDSLRDELRGTVAWVSAHDLPAERIFTSNESWRDRNAEFVRIVNGIVLRRDANPEQELRELASWPTKGRWAPRADLAPGQHAGVLTTPMILYNLPDRRQRMSIIYDPLWCVQADSIGASPESIISIKSGNLQFDGAGWHELAGRPVCTNCHARLDYGMQFFWGNPNGYLQEYFVPDLQLKGRGPLYVDNIDDPRGEADLNPQGFAQLAVAQPEFRSCMARDFAAYVLGNTVTHEQLAAIEAVAKPNATPVRALMRTSLLTLVNTWSARRVEPAATAAATSPAADIAITPSLAKELGAHCLDCHDDDADAKKTGVAFSKSTLPRETIVTMLADVASGRMPKNRPLAAVDRRRFLEAFVAATWSGDDAATARSYYVDRMEALPAYRPEVVLDLVAAKSRSRGTLPWRMLEAFVRPELQQVTPGLVATGSLAAIEGCRAAGRNKSHDDLARCLSESIGIKMYAIDPR